MGLNKIRLGDYVERYAQKCNIPHLTVDDVSGVNKDKEFFEPSKQVGKDTSNYKVVPPNYFACNLMHVGRDMVLPIAINRTNKDKYVSPAYTVFRLINEDVILKEFLFIFVNSSERDRYFWFHCDSSVRDGMEWSSFCDIELEIPSVEIQRKYVAIYNGLLSNLRAYESAIEDLKLTCDAFVDNLKKATKSESIGQYIELSEKTNNGLSVDSVRGVSIEKKFIPTKADMNGVSVSNYKLVPPLHFSYVPTTSRNGNKITIAINDSEETYLVSTSYIVFSVKKDAPLLPEYLMLFFTRADFDRYARFHSWGSARETFDWAEMCDVHIPIPAVEIQKSIVEIFHSYNSRKKKIDEIKSHLSSICPILVKGAIEEAKEG